MYITTGRILKVGFCWVFVECSKEPREVWLGSWNTEILLHSQIIFHSIGNVRYRALVIDIASK